MWTREQLKTNAKVAFKRNYWPCVGAGVIIAIAEGIGTVNSARNGGSQIQQNNYYMDEADVFSGGIGSVAGSVAGTMTVALAAIIALLVLVLGILVVNVIRVGANRFFIQNREGMPGVGTVFSGFTSGHYGNLALTMFLRDLFVGLWTLLLIIPGIVKSYEYYMVPYILAENPGMDRKEAFAISKRMMTGEKMDTFVLELSFIGWELLGVFTCGLLGIFYVRPYIEATKAELYAYMKSKAFQEGYIQ